jgi:hypothetical protein
MWWLIQPTCYVSRKVTLLLEHRTGVLTAMNTKIAIIRDVSPFSVVRGYQCYGGARSSIFCHITPCSPPKDKRRFGVTCLHLQDSRVRQARNQHGSKALPAACHVLLSCLDYSLAWICPSETSNNFQQFTWHHVEISNLWEECFQP